MIWLMSNNIPINKIRQIEKIDKAFEYVLLLTTFLAAGLFELATYLQSQGIGAKQGPLFLSRVFFSQLLLLGLLWVASVAVNEKNKKILMKLTSWGYGIMVLRSMIIAFIDLTFIGNPAASQEAALAFNIASFTSIGIMFLAFYFVLKSYILPLRDIAYYQNRRWALKISLGWALCAGISYGIVFASYIGIYSLPFPTIFTGLLPLEIGTFTFTFLLTSILQKGSSSNS